MLIALGHVADAIEITPIVRGLRDLEPTAWISVLTYTGVDRVWRSYPLIDEVLTTPEPAGRGARAVLGRAIEMARTFRRLRGRFDTIAIAHNGARPRFIALAALSGARARIGYARGPLARLLTRALTPREGTTPREAMLEIARALGVTDPDPQLSLLGLDIDHAGAERLLERLPIDPTAPLVMLHPGSDWGCQMWSFEGWARVADHLADRYGARALVTGVASEQWMADAISDRARSTPISICGETTLEALAALLCRADLFVTVDSGPLALAAAARTPTVALDAIYQRNERPTWGALAGDEQITALIARDDGRHRWYAESRDAKVAAGIRSCIDLACIGQGVMARIAPSDVIEAIDERLAARSAHGDCATAASSEPL